MSLLLKTNRSSHDGPTLVIDPLDVLGLCHDGEPDFVWQPGNETWDTQGNAGYVIDITKPGVADFDGCSFPQ